ncbi:serpin family protein [soil metagenome]
MTNNGASGNTQEQIQYTLGFEGLDAQELNTAFKDLQKLLLNMDKKTQFHIAKSIWYRNTFSLRDGFNAIIKENYDGEIKPLDFNDPQAKNLINQWVETKTQNKIKELIKAVTTDHVMFLINAIYFKSSWTYRFDKSATKPMDYKKVNDSVVSRDMMFSDKLKFLYSHDDQVQFIDLPYGKQQFYMSIILPREDVSINDVINNLDAEKLKKLVQQADTSGANLYLPKFKLEYEIKLNEALKAMGMEEAFSNRADFSNFFTNPESLAISEVNHKTFIEVDEEGTEAAAATSVGIIVTSIPATPPAIHINRPFILFIREKSTENILFAGKILDPAG